MAQPENKQCHEQAYWYLVALGMNPHDSQCQIVQSGLRYISIILQKTKQWWLLFVQSCQQRLLHNYWQWHHHRQWYTGIRHVEVEYVWGSLFSFDDALFSEVASRQSTSENDLFSGLIGEPDFGEANNSSDDNNEKQKANATGDDWLIDSFNMSIVCKIIKENARKLDMSTCRYLGIGTHGKILESISYEHHCAKPAENVWKWYEQAIPQLPADYYAASFSGCSSFTQPREYSYQCSGVEWSAPLVSGQTRKFQSWGRDCAITSLFCFQWCLPQRWALSSQMGQCCLVWWGGQVQAWL